MNNHFKKKIISMLRPDGHRHFSLQEAILCKPCQPKVLAAKELYDKAIRKDPNLIKRVKPTFQPSVKLQETWGQLQERVKHDKLYQEHLKKSMTGTVEEQNLEADRVNSGFYKKHSDWNTKIL